MRFGLVIIGDEILSGKRQDKHFPKMTEIMSKRGLRLSWVSYQADNREQLAQFFRQTLSSGDVVFSCGGIGNTPDDHTRQAAAAAMGVDLELHPDAEKELRARFNNDLTPQRILLGSFPKGSSIIPNPFNRIPGFSLAGTHFFTPGFPQMAWPMIEWSLDTHFREHFSSRPVVDKAFLLTGPDAYESGLLSLMERIVADYPDLRLFSLPSINHDEKKQRYLELGVEGSPERVTLAMEDIRTEIERRGIPWSWRQ